MKHNPLFAAVTEGALDRRRLFSLALSLVSLVLAGITAFVQEASAAVSTAAITIVNGAVTEETTPDAHQIPHVLRELTEREPSRNPLWVAMNKVLVGEAPKNEKITWEEDGTITRATAINNGAGYAAGAPTQTWTVDDASFLQVDDLLLLPGNADRAVVRVTAVPSATTVTVARVDGASGSAFANAPAVADNDVVFRIHTSKKEGFSLGTSRTTMPEQFYNYIEDIEAVITITGRRERTANYTKDDWQRSKDRQLFDFLSSQEYRLWFGKRAKVVSGSDNRTFTGGILSYLTKTVSAAETGYDEGDLIDLFRQTFSGNSGSPVRYWYVDPYLAAALNKVPLDKVRRTQYESPNLKMGLEQIHVAGMGTLRIVPEQAFAEAGFSRFGVILDHANVRLHPQRRMDGNVIDNMKVAGTDTKTLQLYATDTLSVRYADTHVITKLT